MNTIYKMLIVLVCINAPLAFATDVPSVPELLDRYTESQEKLSSFIAETERFASLKVKIEDKPVYIRQITNVYVSSERHHIKKRWSEVASKDALTPIEDVRIMSNLWDGNRYMIYKLGSHVDMDRNEESAKALLDVTTLGIPFLIRTSAFERLDITLRQAKTISVRDKLEQVGSENCYVIDAKTASGAYTVWIDPQHDYHIAKAQIRVVPGEKYRMRILGDGERCFFQSKTFVLRRLTGYGFLWQQILIMKTSVRTLIYAGQMIVITR